MTNLEGRVIRRRQVVSHRRPGVKSDIDVLRELAERLGCGEKFAFDVARRRVRRVPPRDRRRHRGLRGHHLRAHRPRGRRLLAVPVRGPSRHAAAVRRAVPPRRRQGEVPRRRAPPGGRGAGRRLTRSTSPPAATRSITTPARRRGRSAKLDRREAASRGCNCTRELAARLGVDDGWRVTVESRRGRVEFAAEVTAGIRPDTLFAPFHWGGRQAANLLTNPALDPTSRMPEFKLAAVRIVARARARRHGGPRVTRKKLAIIGNGMATGRLLDELAAPRRAAAVRRHRVRRGAARVLQPHPAQPRAARRRGGRHHAEAAGVVRRARRAACAPGPRSRGCRPRRAGCGPPTARSTTSTSPCSPPAASRGCRRSRG